MHVVPQCLKEQIKVALPEMQGRLMSVTNYLSLVLSLINIANCKLSFVARVIVIIIYILNLITTSKIMVSRQADLTINDAY